MKDKKKGGRPANDWKVHKIAIPAPLLGKVYALIAEFKAEQLNKESKK